MKNDLKSQEIVLKTYPFNVEQLQFAERLEPYYRLRCPDWVNVLPITAAGEAVLIRQFRVGCLKTVLETPGGVVDENEKDPTLTAARELEEETGYTSTRLLSLGQINPNPALFGNRCYFFLALNCQLADPRKFFPDCDEQICTETFKAGQLEELVRTGQIQHSLSALCIFLALKYINSYA